MKLIEATKQVIAALAKHSATRPLAALLSKGLSIKPEEYKRFDRLERWLVYDSVLRSLTEALTTGKSEELDSDAKLALLSYPKIPQDNPGIHPESDHGCVLKAFGDVDLEKKKLYFVTPMDPLTILEKMSYSDHIVLAFLRNRLRPRGATEGATYLVRNIVKPVREALRNTLGDDFAGTLRWMKFATAMVYGIPCVRPLSAENVYLEAFDFYKRHEGSKVDRGVTVTFATSSGLPNPLEQHGTDYFLKRYGISSPHIPDQLLKNPFRVVNFRLGILNPNITSKRIYVWDRDGTSRALRQAWSLVPPSERNRFFEDAVRLLENALRFERLKIVELPAFDEWMKRYTRIAKGEVLISLRGTESKRISHAVSMTFDIDTLRHRRKFIQRILNWLQVPSLFFRPLAIACVVLTLAETAVGELAESVVDEFDAWEIEEAINQTGTTLKEFGGITGKSARKTAARIVEELLSPDDNTQ